MMAYPNQKKSPGGLAGHPGRDSCDRTQINLLGGTIAAKPILASRLGGGTAPLGARHRKEDKEVSSVSFKSCEEKRLPQFVRDILSAPPRRGEGLNLWFFRVARVLHPFRNSDEIMALLEAATDGTQVKDGEIERAVGNSAAVAWQPGKPVAPASARPRWPKVNQKQREAVIAAHGGLVDLWELSPIRFDCTEPLTEEIIDALFPGNPLLCCGASSNRFSTRPREQWRGSMASLQLIVPSPMSARTGKTKDGRTSEHTLDNTGPRRFLVIEQDAGTADEQAGILLHLAKKAPLALAVFSGKKSIHGWFYCKGQPEERLNSFMHYAVSLGADPATWTRSLFIRMPDGTRDTGARQTIFYFNPEVLK